MSKLVSINNPALLFVVLVTVAVSHMPCHAQGGTIGLPVEPQVYVTGRLWLEHLPLSGYIFLMSADREHIFGYVRTEEGGANHGRFHLQATVPLNETYFLVGIHEAYPQSLAMRKLRPLRDADDVGMIEIVDFRLQQQVSQSNLDAMLGSSALGLLGLLGHYAGIINAGQWQQTAGALTQRLLDYANHNEPGIGAWGLGEMYPAGGIPLTGRKPEFFWPEEQGATSYNLAIHRDGQSYLSTWVSTASWTPSEPMPAGNYRWWIQPWSQAAGRGEWSAAATFSIPSRAPGRLTLIAPQGAQDDYNLTYRWQKDPNASWYRLWISHAGRGTWHDQWYSISGEGEATVTRSGHPGGNFSWYVQGWGPDGGGPWSGPMTFSTPSADPAKPVLISPAGQISAQRPSFSWEAAARATWYKIYIQNIGTGRVEANNWVEATGITVERNLPLGNYRWWVASWNEATRKDVWSDPLDFTITTSDPGDVPSDMVFVQGGTLPDIGNGVITVGSFHIGKYEVTWGEWKAVRAEAAARGYDIGDRGAGCADNHPVHTVNWYDVVKWCNLRSEIEGRTPVYRVGGNIYKFGEHDNVDVTAAANGYRLPTDAEWEYAARGGIHSQGYTYSGGNDKNAVAWYRDNSGGAACNYLSGRGTWPVGQKMANELGIHDMTGNVAEWCFDWHPPDDDEGRVTRGGSYGLHTVDLPVNSRFSHWPDIALFDLGFRVVLPAQ